MIPTYNQAGFIHCAITSALAQNYANLEIIVGDDASTDETNEIASAIFDDRLIYIRNSANLGRVGNYHNLLYNHATGVYVVNLDGDDYFTDVNFINDAVTLVGENKAVVMVTARANWTIEGTNFISSIPTQKQLTGLEIVKKLPRKEYFFKHMASLYRRDDAIKIGFYGSQAISSDWESLYRLALRGEVKYLDRNVGVWRIHGANESLNLAGSRLFTNLSIWPSVYEDAALQGMNPLHAKYRNAKCIAWFASSFATNLSKDGNSGLFHFVIAVIKKYPAASILMAITPKYIARILLSFLGYYRSGSLRI